jgi:ribosomal-protein-alanine N-acetyltransferase
MGLEYKIIQSERKVLDRVICNCCGKEIRKESEAHWNECGEPFANFFEPCFEDFFLLEKRWGYSSSQDGQTHRAVLCEDCYKKIFKDVKIEVTHYF